MVEPEKPFACTMPDCGMTFTNEDHLNVHTKKHDMVLQFGCEQKAAVFVADQTPTPTRFIRNCEEVGLFQDLQNVNPFDEGFKRAIETKQGILSLEHGCTPSTEDLHTPQMFPLLDPGDSVFSTTNNHRNITISRSSSDETGAIKEFETTRISKLTNEVTTISRIVEKHDDTPKSKDAHKNSISYTNNVIQIHSNVEIRKDMDRAEDVVIKDISVAKDTVFNKDNNAKDAFDRLQVEVPPIMSQKSIDFVVDSLTTDYITEKGAKDGTIVIKDGKTIIENNSKDDKNLKEDGKSTNDSKTKREDYEVILKLPSGQQIKLVSADGVKDKPKSTKDLLKKVLTEKVESQKIINSLNIIPNCIPTIASGTLIPVSIVNTNLVNTNLVNTNLVNTNLVNTNLVNTNLVNTNLVSTNLVNTNLVNTNLVNTIVTPNIVNTHLVNPNYVPKLPLKVFDKKPIRRKCSEGNDSNKIIENNKKSKDNIDVESTGFYKIPPEKRYWKSKQTGNSKCKQNLSNDLESRSAASRRYRARLKETMAQQSLENKQLKELNERLVAEKAALKTLIIEHMKRCHSADDLRELQEKIGSIETKD